MVRSTKANSKGGDMLTLEQILQGLDEQIAIAQAHYEEENHEDWRNYYAGLVDGLHKAKNIIDPAVQYMGEEAMC
jgi:hypothetical protein